MLQIMTKCPMVMNMEGQDKNDKPAPDGGKTDEYYALQQNQYVIMYMICIMYVSRELLQNIPSTIKLNCACCLIIKNLPSIPESFAPLPVHCCRHAFSNIQVRGKQKTLRLFYARHQIPHPCMQQFFPLSFCSINV